MGKRYQMQGNWLVYRMPQEVDHHSAKTLSEEMDGMIEHRGVRSMVLDFRDTDFMDSSGIGVIIGRCKLLRLFQGELRVQNLSDRMMRIFRASGLWQITSLYTEQNMEKERNFECQKIK